LAYKILLADDSVTVQKIITLTFKDEHVDVESVNNGDEAINKLQYLRPSLIMADVSIPGRDGYQICEYVKTHPDLSHIPVVLLVPAFEPFDAEKARRMGADHHLTKPFQSIKTLITTVKNLIEPPLPEEVIEAEDESAAEAATDEEFDNVVDMTSRIAPAREHIEPEPSVVEGFRLPDQPAARSVYSSLSLPVIDEEDQVLDIDDVLAEAWETPPPLRTEPALEPPVGEQAAVFSRAQIDEIVDRVVARLTDSVVERLVPRLSEEIAGLIAPEMADRDRRQPDDRQLSLHDPDALLEIDEL